MRGQSRLITVLSMAGQPQLNKLILNKILLTIIKPGLPNISKRLRFLKKCAHKEKKPWQYVGPASVNLKVPGYLYMTEQDVRDGPRTPESCIRQLFQ